MKYDTKMKNSLKHSRISVTSYTKHQTVNCKCAKDDGLLLSRGRVIWNFKEKSAC